MKKFVRIAAVACLPISNGGAYAAAVLGVDNIEAIKENKRVAIGRFSIEFYTQLFGEGRSGKNTARMTANLARPAV